MPLKPSVNRRANWLACCIGPTDCVQTTTRGTDSARQKRGPGNLEGAHGAEGLWAVSAHTQTTPAQCADQAGQAFGRSRDSSSANDKPLKRWISGASAAPISGTRAAAGNPAKPQQAVAPLSFEPQALQAWGSLIFRLRIHGPDSVMMRRHAPAYEPYFQPYCLGPSDLRRPLRSV